MGSVKKLITLDDIDVNGKRVLVRVDFNVPLKNGHVEDHSRIQACLPTIKRLLNDGAALMLMSHLGRPKEGKFDLEFSMEPVAKSLSVSLGTSVKLVSNWLDGVELEAGDVVMLENVRFMPGEKADDAELAKQMASLCDVYVNDAFATAHRAQASTHGVAKYAPIACAGPLLLAEIDALTKALANPAKPMAAIVGGSKVSTKLTILESLLEKVDQLIVGGGIANTFLKAKGKAVGNSLYEEELVPEAQKLMKLAEQQGKSIPLPTDVVCAKAFSEDAEAVIKPLADVDAEDLILDVGPETAKHYAEIVKQAATIFWNGPLGVFEFDQFSKGSEVLAQAIANSDGFSIAGGGDTLSAISKFGVGSDVSYISTAGGAMLEFVEGKQLPAIVALEESALAFVNKQSEGVAEPVS